MKVKQASLELVHLPLVTITPAHIVSAMDLRGSLSDLVLGRPNPGRRGIREGARAVHRGFERRTTIRNSHSSESVCQLVTSLLVELVLTLLRCSYRTTAAPIAAEMARTEVPRGLKSAPHRRLSPKVMRYLACRAFSSVSMFRRAIAACSRSGSICNICRKCWTAAASIS
jgi:hypothetical protein